MWVKVRTRLRRSGACHGFIPGSPRAARAGERHRPGTGSLVSGTSVGKDRDQRSMERGEVAVITDRDCDAAHELLLMADAHLWSVSGRRGRGRC